MTGRLVIAEITVLRYSMEPGNSCATFSELSTFCSRCSTFKTPVER